MKNILSLLQATVAIALIISLVPAPVHADTHKYVFITFDDGWTTQYDVARPILDTYGFKASFSIIISYVGTGEGVQDGMNWTEIQQLQAEGHNIASHGVDHLDLTSVNSTVLAAECTGSKQTLESYGLRVKGMVYPYFAYDDTVIAATKSAGYLGGRAGIYDATPVRVGWNPTNITGNNEYTLDCYDLTIMSYAQFQAAVDSANDTNIIGLVYHSVSDNVLAPDRVSVADFTGQMDYLADNGFTIIKWEDFLPPIPQSAMSSGLGLLSLNSIKESQVMETGLSAFQIQSSSDVGIDISISGSDLVGGDTWTLSDTATAAENQFGLKAGIAETSGDYDITIKKSAPYNLLVSNLLTGMTQKFGIKFYAPTTFTDGVVKTGTVSLTITAH